MFRPTKLEAHLAGRYCGWSTRFYQFQLIGASNLYTDSECISKEINRTKTQGRAYMYDMCPKELLWPYMASYLFNVGLRCEVSPLAPPP